MKNFNCSSKKYSPPIHSSIFQSSNPVLHSYPLLKDTMCICLHGSNSSKSRQRRLQIWTTYSIASWIQTPAYAVIPWSNQLLKAPHSQALSLNHFQLKFQNTHGLSNSCNMPQKLGLQTSIQRDGVQYSHSFSVYELTDRLHLTINKCLTLTRTLQLFKELVPKPSRNLRLRPEVTAQSRAVSSSFKVSQSWLPGFQRALLLTHLTTSMLTQLQHFTPEHTTNYLWLSWPFFLTSICRVQLKQHIPSCNDATMSNASKDSLFSRDFHAISTAQMLGWGWKEWGKLW